MRDPIAGDPEMTGCPQQPAKQSNLGDYTLNPEPEPQPQTRCPPRIYFTKADHHKPAMLYEVLLPMLLPNGDVRKQTDESDPDS